MSDLPQAPLLASRRAGVMLPVASLPGGAGIGDLGAAARRFVDQLAAMGCGFWQVLPLVPPDEGGSPYSSWSAFASSPWLVDLEELVGAGLLQEAGVRPTGEHVAYASLPGHKGARLESAARALLGASSHPWRSLLEKFRVESAWLADVATFAALSEAHGRQPFWSWPAALRDRQPAALAEARARLGERIEIHEVIQFFAARQLEALRAYAAARGVAIVGDLPIYVARDSSDVWAARDLFLLDAEAQPTVVAGVPPDAFSDTGQLWGNPLYDWGRLAATGYDWWKRRLRRALELYDVVRIDHFRGFAAYWEVPASAPDARTGRWVTGPGRALFDAMADGELGGRSTGLPIIAEDLGVIDQPVIELLAAVGFPGMRVLQFAFGSDDQNTHLPKNHTPRTVVYTGTHDNDTVRGWWPTLPEWEKARARAVFGVEGDDILWSAIATALESVGQTAIIPVQDLLGLGSEARINRPATVRGNWSWRLSDAQLAALPVERFRDLVARSGRLAAGGVSSNVGDGPSADPSGSATRR